MAVGDLNDIVQRLEPALGPLVGPVQALDGGITNRNYRVTLGAGEYVIRLPGRDTELLGIDREAERLASQAAAELGLSPRVEAVLENCLVTRFVSSRGLAAGEAAGAVEELAAALRAFHDSAPALPSRFWVPELLGEYAALVSNRGGSLPPAYESASVAAARIAAVLAPGSLAPCHNDLLPANIIRPRDGGRLLIVDWEYAGMGDRRFDLGNLSVNNGFDEATDDRLLAAYHGEAPGEGRRAALKLMRVLSDAREGAWGVLQGAISELDFDFEGYAQEHFERLLATVQSPLFERWLATAGD